MHYTCIVLKDDRGSFNGIQIIGLNGCSLYSVFSITLKIPDGKFPILSSADQEMLCYQMEDFDSPFDSAFDSAVVAMFCYINRFPGFCDEDAIKGFNQSELRSFLCNFNFNQSINVPSEFECKDVDIHIQKIKRLLKRVVVGISPEAALAFLRGTHRTLGTYSPLYRLPNHIVRTIVTGSRPQ